MTSLDRLIGVITGTAHEGEQFVNEIEATLRIEAPTALARATSLLAWKALWEREHGKSRGGDRRSKDFKRKTFPFDQAAAERLGLTERAIRLDVKLAEDLGPHDIAALWTTKHADNAAALRMVAALPGDRRSPLLAIIAENPALSISAALIAARLRAAADSDEQAFQRLVVMWDAANSKLKRRFLVHAGVDVVQAAAIARRCQRGADNKQQHAGKTKTAA